MNAEHRLSILIGKGAFCLLEIDPAAGVKWAWCLRLVAPGRCALLPAVGGPGGPARPCGTSDALATALLQQTVVLGKVSLLPQKRGGGERAGGSPASPTGLFSDSSTRVLRQFTKSSDLMKLFFL